MKNILTIDVESWIHYWEALENGAIPDDPAGRRELDRGHLGFALAETLDLLDRSGNRATFFVLGELSQWIPDVLDEIRNRGHEIGYHGHNHRMIESLEILKNQLALSRDFIARFQPVGFRAPQLYLVPTAMEELKRSGFIYSSSSYGPFESAAVINGVREIPISTLRWRPGRVTPQVLPRPLAPSILLREIPFGSAMSAGLLGGATSRFIRRSNRKNRPAVVMLHPWQLFPPEAMTGSRYKRKIIFKHTPYLPYAFSRAAALRNLIGNEKFTSFSDYFRIETGQG